MDKKEEDHIRYQIDQEKFKYEKTRSLLMHHYSLISKFGLGLMGVMVGFVAAFQEFKTLAISFAVGFMLLFWAIGIYSEHERKQLEHKLKASEKRISKWYEELTRR